MAFLLDFVLLEGRKAVVVSRLGDISWSITSAAGPICSVDPESLAELARSLDEIDHVDLLLEEESEEVSIILAA